MPHNEVEQLNGPVILKKRFGGVFLGIVIDERLLFIWVVEEEIYIDHENHIIAGVGWGGQRFRVQIMNKRAWNAVVKEVAWATKMRNEFWSRELIAAGLSDHKWHCQGDEKALADIARQETELECIQRKLECEDDTMGWFRGVEDLLAAQQALRLKAR